MRKSNTKKNQNFIQKDEMLERSFDAAPDLIMILDTQHKILRANKAMAKRMGTSPNKLVGQNCYEVVHGTKSPPESCPHECLLKDGKEHSSDTYQELLGGDFLITVSPIYDSDQTIVGSVHIARDITYRVQMEQQLKKAHDKLERKVQMRTKELVIANEQLLKEIEERKRAEQDLKNREQSLAEAQRIAHLGNWDWNIVTNELYWSDEIYRIFGLAPQEFGATYEAFLNSVHPDDRPLVERSVDAALYEGKSYSIDHRIVLLDGSERIVHEQAEVTRDDSEQAIQMTGTVHDITERKNAEEDRRLLREELTHMSRITTIGTLAGALAHEINQPLTAIMSNAQAALRFLDAEKPNIDELREILSDITNDTIRSSDVIHQLRDFMKKGEIALIPLNINETIKEVVNLTHRDAESRHISIRIDTNEDLPEVMGDKVQLQQVILNLVINGFDAMMYQDADSRELVIQTEQDEDNSIHIAVQDTGMGIEEEKLEQIFEPFVSTKPEGMGLGLSINQYIINAHNGRMWATNNPDHGATVHFTLPVKKT
jgi:PAS domain S-box-containing protein